jgi:hypothetical protein
MLAAGFVSMLVLALGCAGKSENGACSWLSAPSSFVDAGHQECTAKPAGQICNKSTGSCLSVCQPSEYLLTCRTTNVSHLAITKDALEGPIIDSDHSAICSPVEMVLEEPRDETAYCCPCER